MQLFCRAQKTVLVWSTLISGSESLFTPSSSMVPELLGGVCCIEVPFMAVHATDTYSPQAGTSAEIVMKALTRSWEELQPPF